MALKFEWDPKKAESNLAKHAVSFSEASTIFADQLSITITDPDSDPEECRYIDIGISYQNRLLVVCYVERSDNIRIVSARRATKPEQKMYEDETI